MRLDARFRATLEGVYLNRLKHVWGLGSRLQGLEFRVCTSMSSQTFVILTVGIPMATLHLPGSLAPTVRNLRFRV